MVFMKELSDRYQDPDLHMIQREGYNFHEGYYFISFASIDE